MDIYMNNKIKVDNAVIMAAGLSSRFAPLSHEMPKALIEVKGEIMIERQIKQLKQAGISDIYIVVGYMAEKFEYLREKFGVKIVHNRDYLVRNNNSTIYAVKDILANTYICSADNYFPENPFESEVDGCYYAAIYSDGPTKEWCMELDADDRIKNVTVGGRDSWFMLGHTFWDREFSEGFLRILLDEYDLPETADLLWESIYIKHIDELNMKIRRYPTDDIVEFDTLDELREFDSSYVDNTRSAIIAEIARKLNCGEGDIVDICAVKSANEAVGFSFYVNGIKYEYIYNEGSVRVCE